MPEHIKCEYLGGNISVFCSDTHRFGTDAVLLESFANMAKKPAKCIMDMGTGCGIIPMLFARDNPKSHIYALDIQPDAVKLVERAIEYNQVANRVTAVCCDLKNLPVADTAEYKSKFELVTMNPPYKRKGSGIMTQNDGLNIARFELMCSFDDICSAAAAIMKPQGRFCVCNRPSRLCDMIYAMKQHKIEPKRMRNVSQKPGDKPMLVLLEGVLGGNADIDIEPELYLEDFDGKMSAEYAKIYEKWDYERKNAPNKEI